MRHSQRKQVEESLTQAPELRPEELLKPPQAALPNSERNHGERTPANRAQEAPGQCARGQIIQSLPRRRRRTRRVQCRAASLLRQ